MIREAEMEEMEKKWQEQNRKVMEEHPGVELTAANGGGAEMVPLPPARASSLSLRLRRSGQAARAEACSQEVGRQAETQTKGSAKPKG